MAPHLPENFLYFIGDIPVYINDGFQVLLELGAVEAV